ncbi:MAG: HDOD domain-containing protein [Desulfovibrionaceae bacterium]
MSNHLKGQEFLAQLSEIKEDLPYSPQLLRDLFTMTGEDSLAPLAKVGETIAVDPTLTAKVLAMANSAFYGLQAKVNSVTRAITVLGLMEIRNLVLLLGLDALSHRRRLPSGCDLRLFWRHELAVAACAKHLAHQTGNVDPDILFTAGLLHDFGKLLVALHRPDDWQVLEAMVRHAGLAFAQAEEAHWGVDHGLAGAMVLNAWDLPPELTEPINWHHAPELCQDFPKEASIVFLADALVNALEAPDYPTSRPWREAAAQMGLDPDELLAATRELLADEHLFQLVAHMC